MVTVAVQNLSLLSHLTIVSLWHNRCTGSPKTHWGDQRFMHATMARSSSSSFQSHIESARQPFFLSPQCLKITQKVSFNIASEASYVYILSRQKLIKNAQNSSFWRVFRKPEACGQTVLPDRSLLIGQKLVKNAPKWSILASF